MEITEPLEEWGYLTARNEFLFGLETDVIGRREQLQGDPEDFIVIDCKD